MARATRPSPDRENPLNRLATNPQLALAIDQGGHASRALIFDNTGEQIAQAYRPLHTHTPQPGWVEHHADELMASIRDAIANAMGQLGDNRFRVVTAGLASQRSTIVCWDALTGHALSRNQANVGEIGTHFALFA